MRLLTENLKGIAATITALGVIVVGTIALLNVREDACDALLWTIQRDLFAAQQMRTKATELGPKLTEQDAIEMNEQVLKSAGESVQTFEQRREKEKKECGR